MYTHKLKKGKLVSNGWQKLNAPLEYINLHVRGGYILPTQDPLGALNTKNSRKNPFGLLIVLDTNGFAQGDLFYDDGESFLQRNELFFAKFSFKQDRLVMNLIENSYDFATSAYKIDTIKIYGSKKSYIQCSLDDKKIGKLNSNSIKQSLQFDNLNLYLLKSFQIKFH
jgi:alpha-glucosidase (family GH31 glycosyl hydrolase)